MCFRNRKTSGHRAVAVATALIAAAVFASITTGVIGTPHAAAATPGPAQITVATYNVCAEKCVNGTSKLKYSFSVRAPKIAAQVRAFKVDVVGVQEVGPSTSSMSKLARQMKATGYILGANKGGRGMFYKSATLAATDEAGRKLAGRGYRVKSTRSGAKSRGGSIQVLRLRANGQRVIIAVAHLSALDGTKYDKHRLDEIRKVHALVKPYKAMYPTAAVIYAGDFNSLRHSNTRYESDTARWRVNSQMASYGYSDGFTKALNRGAASKSTSLNKRPGDRRKFPPAFQLDRIYVDDKAQVRSFKVVKVRPGGYKYQWSDHRMVYAKVTVTG